MQRHPVVYLAPFQEGVSGGIEQRAAVCDQVEVFVIAAAVYQAESR
jgi:hypothetical protein